MVWQTMTDMGLKGLDGAFLWFANVWPGNVPVLLFALFLIVTLGSYFTGKRSEGDDNIFGSFFIASLFIVILATLFTLVSQDVGLITYKMIDWITFSVTIAVFIGSTILFLVSKSR